MELNGENEKIAGEILCLLAENKCTVEQSSSILTFVQRYAMDHSAVQFDRETFLSEFSV